MKENSKAIIESILFSTGRAVEVKELMGLLEKSADEVISLVDQIINDYKDSNKGIEIIKINNSYQMCTKKEYYEYIVQLSDKKGKPNLSNASLETIAIIAYNPNVTRAQIEAIRGVNCDGTIYKLLEYNLIEESGKLDAPGKPTTYVTTNKFLKMFGLGNLDELPELPKYKIDENQQIIVDDSE